MAPFGRKRLRNSGRPSEEEEVVPGAPDFRRGERRDLSGSEEDGMEGETPVTDRHGEKRPSARTVEEEVGAEVHSMLEKLGDDITKSLLAKRKRLEMNTNALMNTSNQKFEYVWKVQHEQRENLNYDYSQQFSNLFQLWGKDLQKAGDQGGKLHDAFQKQRKVFQQYRIIHNQRLKAIRKLYEQFLKGIKDLEKDHENHLTEAQRELKEELALLQKKMLMETQRQEVANIRKSLQSLFL